VQDIILPKGTQKIFPGQILEERFPEVFSNLPEKKFYIGGNPGFSPEKGSFKRVIGGLCP